MAIVDENIRWCENNEYEPRIDELARVNPPSEVKSSGLKDRQPIPRQWLNNQFYETWQIVKNLQAQINTLSVSGDNAALLQTIWQVGDVWMTQTEDNPADRFGFGTWEKQQGRYVVGSSESDTDFNGAGVQGGSKTHTHSSTFSVSNHTLSEAEVPTYVHTHEYRDRYYAEKSASLAGATNKVAMPSGYNGGYGSNSTDTDNTQWLYYDSTTGSSTFGGGGAHKHNMTGGVQSTKTLPPYETYHIWKRIA